MRKRLDAGESHLEAIIILAVLIVIILVSSVGGGARKNVAKGTTLGGSVSGTNQTASKTAAGSSIVAQSSTYSKDIRINQGNARYAYQPFEEYITLSNSGKNPVSISNWQLKNGKDKRGYDTGGGLRFYSADSTFIPKGALFISPYGGSVLSDIVLQPGDKAIVTTGSIGSQSPYKIVSFKENICSGYLQNMDEYHFTPALKLSCPRPENEPGVAYLDTECRNFIDRLSSCREPEFETRDKEGDICYNCVNGKPLSNSCVTFIKNHFNYNSCIANHVNDPNFSGKTWRIFLGQGWEMWAKQYENIQLFDMYGRLVDSVSY